MSKPRKRNRYLTHVQRGSVQERILTMLQSAVLANYGKGSATVGTIVSAFIRPYSSGYLSAARRCRELATAGLLKRVGDHRLACYRITPAGRKALREAR